MDGFRWYCGNEAVLADPFLEAEEVEAPPTTREGPEPIPSEATEEQSKSERCLLTT